MLPLPDNIEELDHNTQWMVSANRMNDNRMECLEEPGTNLRGEESQFNVDHSGFTGSLDGRYFNE